MPNIDGVVVEDNEREIVIPENILECLWNGLDDTTDGVVSLPPYILAGDGARDPDVYLINAVSNTVIWTDIYELHDILEEEGEEDIVEQFKEETGLTEGKHFGSHKIEQIDSCGNDTCDIIIDVNTERGVVAGDFQEVREKGWEVEAVGLTWISFEKVKE